MARQVRHPRDILLITLGFPPARGGIQSCLFERARLASERIVVLAPGIPGAREFDREQSFPIYRWPAIFGQTAGIKRLCQLLFPLIIAWRLCQKYDVRRVECGQALPFGAVAWCLRLCKRIPYRVWTYGDDIIKPARWRLVRSLLVGILRHAEAIFAISEFTREHVQALGIPAQTIQIIYPPLAPVHSLSPDALQAGSTPTILTVARLEDRKGIHHIIEMLPALCHTYPDLLYIIAGDGPAKPKLESLARQFNVAKHVQFTGNVSNTQVASLYASCDLFVMLPTPAEEKGEVEGLGMVYLEAAAHGRPAVAWDTGGVAEAVIDMQTGRVVEKDDLMAAQTAIQTLLGDSVLREKLGRGAQRWAAKMQQRSAQAIQSLDNDHEPS